MCNANTIATNFCISSLQPNDKVENNMLDFTQFVQEKATKLNEAIEMDHNTSEN